jgi:hypothetical protein
MRGQVEDPETNGTRGEMSGKYSPNPNGAKLRQLPHRLLSMSQLQNLGLYAVPDNAQ